MNLSDYEAAATRIAFDREPSEDDLAFLGTPERWHIYRVLVRSRFYKVTHAAFPRLAKHLALDPLVDDWLATEPPKTRLFRELPEEFYAAIDWSTHETWIRELATLELAGWTVRYDESAAPAVSEFAFEKEPAMNPTARVMRFQHPVYLVERDDFPTQPGNLCVYRGKKGAPMMWSLNDVAAALIERFIAGGANMTTCVQEVTRARGSAIDQNFLEKLGELISGCLDRGILLGSKSD